MESQNFAELQTDKVQTMYDHILVTRCGRVFTKDRIKHSTTRNNAPYSCKVAGRELKLRKDKDGYLRFNTTINGKHQTILVHRLVAATFLRNRPDGLVVDHIDRDKSNNNVSNLRYVSAAENIRNSVRHKMTPDKKEMAVKMHKIGMSIAAISRALNVQYGSVKFFFKSLVDVPHFERNQ